MYLQRAKDNHDDVTLHAPAISRRRFLANAVTAAATCLVPQNLFAQSPEDFLTRARAANANNKITPSPLRRNVTALRGAGGNILVLTSKEGKLLVDSGYASCQPQLTAALAAINADPIQVLINTHWHFDHVDGNDWMHSAGATIWAHENTRYRMSTTQNIVAYKAIIPTRSPPALSPPSSSTATAISPTAPTPSNSPTTNPPTPTPISPSTSQRPTSSTAATLGGTASIPSSTTPAEAISTA